jgi:hypothetical protein
MQLNYMEKFFSIFGKVTLVLIILSVFIYGGYYLGKSNINFKKPEAVSIRDNKIDFATTEPTTAPTPVATKQLKTIIAGVAKDKGLSFEESQTQLDEKLVLTKGEYSISIFQAATGGALCLYPGDADFEGPSSKFEVFVPLTTKDSRTLRRSGSLNGNAFTVCQKSGDGSYQQPTNYGHISIKLPTNYDKEILNEIDTIISSLKKI